MMKMTQNKQIMLKQKKVNKIKMDKLNKNYQQNIKWSKV